MSSRKKAMEYLHGFDPVEQDRLLEQAEFLEPYVFSGIHLESCKNVLEVGCGVGAQSKILLRRFPKLKLTSFDLSPAQLARAHEHLRTEIRQKRVVLKKADAQKFRFSKKFDGAFLCWFLEHVPDPLAVLKRTRQHLLPGSPIFCSEVFNHTLFLEPYSPAFLKYWFEFNELQWSIQGHPYIGGSLGHLLKEAGFEDVRAEVRPFHFDSRQPELRAKFVEYFFQILLSAEKALLASGRVDRQLVREMRKEVEHVKKRKDSVFFYAFMRASAKAPR